MQNQILFRPLNQMFCEKKPWKKYMNRMAAPNVGGEYYKSVSHFLQHNFPERDDKIIYCSI